MRGTGWRCCGGSGEGVYAVRYSRPPVLLLIYKGVETQKMSSQSVRVTKIRCGQIRRHNKLRHDNFIRSDSSGRNPVTVCIAAMFNWNYGTFEKPEFAKAALVVTDRMITAGDVQYEPQQKKIANITSKVLLMIAGDYSLHSQAVQRTMGQFGFKPNASPEEIAVFYGRAIQAIKLKEAEDYYLAPLGLNSDSFISQQKDMAPHFVTMLTDQMQSYRGEEVEALIVGSSNNLIHVYGVDTRGVVSCHDDVGFAAIGSGGWHARSRLMQIGYVNSLAFANALGFAFAAKRISQVAPGVGLHTDITLVTRNGISPLLEKLDRHIHELYAEYWPKADALGREYISRIDQFLNRAPLAENEASKILPGEHARASEVAPRPTAEAPRQEEGDGGMPKKENGEEAGSSAVVARE